MTENKFKVGDVVYLDDIHLHGKIISFWKVHEQIENDEMVDEFNYVIEDYNGIQHERLEHEFIKAEVIGKNNKIKQNISCCATCSNNSSCYIAENSYFLNAICICDNFKRE